MTTLADVTSLRESGCFSHALTALDQVGVKNGERPTANTLRAELLERTGAYTQSRSITEALLAGKQISVADRSTCELVLGRLELEIGAVDSGIAHLQRSATFASQSAELVRLCWAQLRLLLVLSDRSGPDSVVPLLGELRANVMRSGDPSIMAALHIYLAETEAKRGLLRNAQRHLGIVKRSLSGFSNYWLAALAENVESAIETMRSDFGAALSHAWRCLELAEQSGALSIHESALGNLGNLSLLASRHEEAIDCLTRAQAARKGSDNWIACVDTSARIHLAKNELSECRQLLDEIDRSVTSPSDYSRYVYRHTQLTRVQLLARSGNISDAIRHVDFVLILAGRSGDQLLRDLALLTKAEMLQELNRFKESLAILKEIVAAIPNQAPDFLAQYERSLACALVRSGRLGVAERHRKRAARLYAAVKHESGLDELSRCWEKARQECVDANTDDQDTNVASVVLCDVATIMSHGSRPELVARELVELLSSTQSTTYVLSSSTGTDGSQEVLSHSGDPTTQKSSDTQRLFIGRARERDIEIVITPKPDLESIATINAVKVLLATLHDLERAREEREERATLWPIDELPIGEDGAVTIGHMRDTMALAKRIASANVSVLITGESGTGKEVVARGIHAHSGRSHKPFIPFNCTAVPHDLLESQLFGYRRGAFTGADRDNPGVIRSARDGTLFLDEIGEMSLDLQPKLLRFLESGEICPLGESTPFAVNVRVVAATNSNLEGLVRDGKFREDLFYRLNVIRLPLKPLRERRDEIPTLINHFLIRATEEFKKQHIRIAEETIERLALYAWPGNIRQLQNEIRRMVALAASGTVLKPAVLSEDILKSTAAAAADAPKAGNGAIAVPLGDKLAPTLWRIEREMIKVALTEHHGRVEAAAKALGISRKGLYLKRQRLGL